MLKAEDLVDLPFASKASSSNGMITLTEFEEKQLLYQGRSARHYRIHVRQGQMALHVDKAMIAIMKAGQSIDVQAERIEVSAVSPERSTGEFFVLDES